MSFPIERNNNFSLIRLMCAFAVMYGHSFIVVGKKVAGSNYLDLKLLRLGRLGVFSFFIISGFLVYQSWQKDPNLKSFMIRRLRRIMPPLWVSLIFCVFIVGPLVTTLNIWDYWLNIKTWKFFGYGLFRFLKGSRFLPGVFENMPAHFVNISLWTLPFEIIFYVLLGVFSMVGLLGGQNTRLYKLVGLWVLMILVVFQGDIAPEIWRFHKAAGILQLGGFFWIGVMVGYLKREKPEFLNRFFSLEGFVLGFLLWHLSTFNRFFYQMITLAFLPYGVLSFALAPSLLNRLSVLRVFERNNISFGIYLYGFPVQQTVYYFTFQQSRPIEFWLYNCICFSLVCFLGALSWLLIEKPILKRGYVFPKAFLHRVTENLPLFLKNKKKYSEGAVK